jgi:hypothetical protein
MKGGAGIFELEIPLYSRALSLEIYPPLIEKEIVFCIAHRSCDV